MRHVIFFSLLLITSSMGGGYAARLFILFSFPCSADHEQDWRPCKVVFFGLVTNTLNNSTLLLPCWILYYIVPMLPPSGNPFKCHEEVLYLQPMVPPKRFDIFPPDWGMLRRSRRVQIFL